MSVAQVLRNYEQLQLFDNDEAHTSIASSTLGSQIGSEESPLVDVSISAQKGVHPLRQSSSSIIRKQDFNIEFDFDSKDFRIWFCLKSTMSEC